MLEESKKVICFTETWLEDYKFKTNSNYHFPNYEGIHYERKIKVIIKVGVGFLYILGMTLTIKIKTICVFTMATEKFLQLNYSQKA